MRHAGSNPAATIEYSAASRLRQPYRFARSMLRDLAVSRELAWRLFVRDLTSRYRQTFLGYLWAFLPPTIATAAFVFLRQNGVLQVRDTSIPYVVFVLAGMVLWQTFVDAIFAPTKMINQSRGMLTKISVPHEALLMAGAGDVTFNFLIRSGLLAVVMLWKDIGIGPSLVLAPLGVLLIIMMGLSVGVLLAPFTILFHDVEQFLSAVMTFWLFLTPVLYPPPTEWPATLTIDVNPVGLVLDTTRSWILNTPAEHIGGFILVSVVTAALTVAGWVVYRLAVPIVVERMGA